MRLNREKFLVALIAFEASAMAGCTRDDEASKDRSKVLGAQPAANPLIEGGIQPIPGIPPIREIGINPIREGSVPTREGGVPPTREGGWGRINPLNEGLPVPPIPPGFEGRVPPIQTTPPPTATPPPVTIPPPGRRLAPPGKR
jgi:hypothetical protein